MSLHLDPRQRAILREMGVRVWQPDAPTAPSEDANAAATLTQDDPEKIATGALNTGANTGFAEKNPPSQRSALPTAAAAPAAPAAQTAPRQSDARLAASPVARPLESPPAASLSQSPHGAWRVGQACPLYAETVQAGGARWLVLVETPAAAMASPVFDGPAGKLLDNMLRAARLHQAGAVLYAPLARLAAPAPSPEFSADVAALVRQFRPDVVLVMGRLASQALLASNEAFGRLRGRVHTLHGARAVLTFDATYLLRAPADKAKAWADLCLAMSLAPLAGSGLS